MSLFDVNIVNCVIDLPAGAAADSSKIRDNLNIRKQNKQTKTNAIQFFSSLPISFSSLLLSKHLKKATWNIHCFSILFVSVPSPFVDEFRVSLLVFSVIRTQAKNRATPSPSCIVNTLSFPSHNPEYRA